MHFGQKVARSESYFAIVNDDTTQVGRVYEYPYYYYKDYPIKRLSYRLLYRRCHVGSEAPPRTLTGEL